MAIESIQNEKPPSLSDGGLGALTNDTQNVSPVYGGYLNFVLASYSHGMLLMLRRQRLIIAAIILLLPIVVPLALAMLSISEFADDGNQRFVDLVEELYINILVPLVSLFFAAMLIAEESETHTMPYILTRPIPRSAWVAGRFLAYIILSTAMVAVAILFAFCACTTLSDDLGFNVSDLKLLAHYIAVATIALIAYGSIALFLGAATKRPMVIGVVLFYAWQRLAMIVPGVVDFMTIQKYTTAILPALATERKKASFLMAFGEYQKEIFAVNAGKALVTLALITATFFLLTVLCIRIKQYATSKTAGS